MFTKQMQKSLGLGTALMLLLLMVDTTPIEEIPEPKVAVIYKLPVEKRPEHSVEQEQSAAGSEASAQEVQAEENKIVVNRPEPKPKSKPIAAPKPVLAVAPVPAPAPVPVFQLKINNSLSKILEKPHFASAKNAAQPSSANAAMAGNDFAISNIDTGGANSGKQAGLRFGGQNQVGKMGNGMGGTGKSFGSQGIGEKGKVGTADMYTEKTVHLGSIDPDLLRKILREHIPQFKHCYQRELHAGHELLKGVLDLRFQINSAGRATKVAISVGNSQFSAKGIDCIENVLALIDFPQPKGGGVVNVRQPLNFFSEKDTLN